jgi:RNA polymerase sigma factor (sigma-70 family)
MNEFQRRLVAENRGLVVTIANSPPFPARAARAGVDLDDLIQEGMIGLMAAAERHKAARGPFGVYARKFIRGAIWRLLGDPANQLGSQLDDDWAAALTEDDIRDRGQDHRGDRARDALWDSLAMLEPVELEIVIVKDGLHGAAPMTWEEVAARFGRSVSTVRATYRRARAKLDPDVKKRIND